MAVTPDHWSTWLLERRDGGIERQREATLTRLSPIRDRVLQNAEPLDGVTLLDLGTGDGLIGVAALDRVGPGGSVIFSDISEALLERSRSTVQLRGDLSRAQFVVADAESLESIPDASVDVATTRSVLIYVAAKAKAFSSLYRVLRPGGRVSLFEPINKLMYPEPPARFWGYDLGPVSDLVARVDAMFELKDPALHSAMMDFDDRVLANLAERAGFDRVHVECHIDIDCGGLDAPVSLEALLNGAPNPNAPTVGEAVEVALTKAEQSRFLMALRTAFRENRRVSRMAVAYLTATKAC